MIVKCARCGSKVAREDIYNYRGQDLCEDCYMGALQPPKTCDVTATHLAKKHRQSAGQTGKKKVKHLLCFLINEPICNK